MNDPDDMMSRLGRLGLLGATEDPDSQGHWRTNLGGGQVLVYGPQPSPPDWFWTVYEAAAAVDSGTEPGADAMAERVHREMDRRGRIYKG